MAYNEFAYYYDSLMDDIYYQEYQSFLISQIQNYHKILELGCGTGTFSIMLTSLQKEVLASDLSKDMLEVAKMKASELDIPLETKVVDMVHFHEEENYDAILCLTDGLNYLSTKEQVIATFQNVFNALKKNGRLIFDVHSMHKVDVTFLDYHEHDEEHNDEYDYSFDWHVKKVGEGIIEHQVRIEEDGNLVVNEKHIQKTYPIDFYLEALREAGFEKIVYYGDFKEYNANCDRIIFVVDK